MCLINKLCLVFNKNLAISNHHMKEAYTDYSNKFHSDIDFSFEQERNGDLSFLDVEVSRKGRKFIAAV